ncbi:hypothetical protein [Burkholderia ambifaria]|uniref:hypothetical protein n=1 Tax=Burkholderia ambifaria TaxID=152480 RepID=UPI00158C4CC8|nr:hypothetical protein [Burkholderia ambifaria]
MRHDISSRTLAVLRAVTSERRRYKELEEWTGIPATNWQSAAKGKQKPTAVMIEALSRRWPKYAFWIATGLTDPENGHTAPPGAYTSRQGISPPEVEQLTEKYFDAVTLLQDHFYGPDESIEPPTWKSHSATSAQPIGPAQSTDEPKASTTLGAAIAWLAHQRRLESLREQFKDAPIENDDPRKLIALIDELRLARADDALQLSKKTFGTSLVSQKRSKRGQQ